MVSFPCRASLPDIGAHSDPDSVAVKLRHSAATETADAELPASAGAIAWKCHPPVQGEGETTEHGAGSYLLAVTSRFSRQPRLWCPC